MHLRSPSILQVKILDGLDPGKWEKREVSPEPKLTEYTVRNEGKPPASHGGYTPFCPDQKPLSRKALRPLPSRPSPGWAGS